MQYSTVQYSTVQYSTVQYSTVQYSAVQYSTVQYSAVQYSTVQYNTIRYSTVQYSKIQYSTHLHTNSTKNDTIDTLVILISYVVWCGVCIEDPLWCVVCVCGCVVLCKYCEEWQGRIYSNPFKTIYPCTVLPTVYNVWTSWTICCNGHMRSLEGPQLKQTNKPLNINLRLFYSANRLALLFYTYVIFHFANQFCAVCQVLRRPDIGWHWTVSVGLYQPDCISRTVSVGQTAAVRVAAISMATGADLANNFIFIQFFPCHPTSVPDILRHPEININEILVDMS